MSLMSIYGTVKSLLAGGFSLGFGEHNASRIARVDGDHVPLQVDDLGNLRVRLESLLAGEDLAQGVLGTALKYVASGDYASGVLANLYPVAAAAGQAKTSTGIITGIVVTNRNAALRYLLLFNLASGAPSGSTGLVMTIPIPASAVVTIGADLLGPNGLGGFTAGITWAFSSTGSTYTAATASEHDLVVLGK